MCNSTHHAIRAQTSTSSVRVCTSVGSPQSGVLRVAAEVQSAGTTIGRAVSLVDFPSADTASATVDLTGLNLPCGEDLIIRTVLISGSGIPSGGGASGTRSPALLPLQIDCSAPTEAQVYFGSTPNTTVCALHGGSNSSPPLLTARWVFADPESARLTYSHVLLPTRNRAHFLQSQAGSSCSFNGTGVTNGPSAQVACYKGHQVRPGQANKYGLNCTGVVANGSCAYTEVELWSHTDSNARACPTSCGSCEHLCYEAPGSNIHSHNCSAIVANGDCAYNENALWPHTDSNAQACRVSCEAAGLVNKYGLNCSEVVANDACANTEAGLWNHTESNSLACPAACGGCGSPVVDCVDWNNVTAFVPISKFGVLEPVAARSQVYVSWTASVSLSSSSTPSSPPPVNGREERPNVMFDPAPRAYELAVRACNEAGLCSFRFSDNSAILVVKSPTPAPDLALVTHNGYLNDSFAVEVRSSGPLSASPIWHTPLTKRHHPPVPTSPPSSVHRSFGTRL